METLRNYQFKDFIKLTDINAINEYMVFLEVLRPLKTISNPNYNKYKFWCNKHQRMIQINSVKDLSFGEVTNIRNYFNEATIEAIVESIKVVTGFTEKQIYSFTITNVYGIINYIKQELIDIVNMEINELSDDSFDINLESINANQRMLKFGVLNTIDALAKEDVLRWSEIEKLPYMTVFTKLLMDKEKNSIQKELNEIQKKKMKQ